MNYNFHQINQHEQDECISKGICSISPTLVSLQEVIIVYLRDLSFYLLELKKLGVRNAQIKEHVIEILSGLIVNVDYTPEQFHLLLTRLHEDLLQAKSIYADLCQKNNIEQCPFAPDIKSLKKINYAAAIKEGQRYRSRKIKKYSPEQKHLAESLFILIKSICIHMVELRDYDFDDSEIYYGILEMLRVAGETTTDLSRQKEALDRFVELDYSLLRQLYEKRKEKYGEIIETQVSLSIRPSKAVLVAGSNLRDLERLLVATKNLEIDVYTHGRMIMAHSFPLLKAYPNLVGHFGRGSDSGLVDFAAFPGPIFMTKLSLQRTERLYRSRIFTTDVIASKGVITIKDNDFGPLIESTISAKGFLHSQKKDPTTVGFCEKEVLKKITEVSEKMEKNEIKHLFAIGVSNGTNVQKEYFENFLKLLPEDCFVLSFSYTSEQENILRLPSDFGFPLLYKTFDILSKNTDISKVRMSVLYTRCEQHTISNLLKMKKMGIGDIYFTNCSPNLINPSLVEEIRSKYNVKSYTNPKDDIEMMLKNE